MSPPNMFYNTPNQPGAKNVLGKPISGGPEERWGKAENEAVVSKVNKVRGATLNWIISKGRLKYISLIIQPVKLIY